MCTQFNHKKRKKERKEQEQEQVQLNIPFSEKLVNFFDFNRSTVFKIIGIKFSYV